MKCPECGWGIMEKVTKIKVTGGWETEGDDLKTEQEQTDVWRCIDCLREQEVGDGDSDSED